jgi:NAD-dependent dihydropyrimidine dehydrogenase PreA subunit
MSDPTLLSSLFEHIEIARKLRGLRIHFYEGKCTGTWQCIQVCPIGCWTRDLERRVAIHHDTEHCIACGACVLQCPEEAIELK